MCELRHQEVIKYFTIHEDVHKMFTKFHLRVMQTLMFANYFKCNLRRLYIYTLVLWAVRLQRVLEVPASIPIRGTLI